MGDGGERWEVLEEAKRESMAAGGTHLKFSIQSMPLGSAFENTKQLNEARNCSPHVPCAMPPRHGHSQLISPVSSLNAPCCSASSSISFKDSGSGGVSVGDVLSDGERVLD